MTNAEALITDLELIDDDANAEYVADYIACPSSEDCTYDGKDNSMCTRCKVKWLRSDFED